jgi:putative tryptophan/tyrosine transport system substrate-binding protein
MDHSGSGPGVQLHAVNGRSVSLTGHSNVQVGRLEPATTGHSALHSIAGLDNACRNAGGWVADGGETSIEAYYGRIFNRIRSDSAVDRRTFIGGVASALLAAPLAAHAQQAGKVFRIGILEAIPAAQNAANLEALRKGLRELGYVEGRNLIIEYRSADGRAERFPELASELVRLKADLIVTRGTPAARAAKGATATIPVVIATMGDPRAMVASFARPGGNITGVTTFSTELTAKRIELLKELVPNLSRVALLHNMGNPAAPPEWEETKAAARSLGLQVELLDVRSEGDLGGAFERAVRQHVDALLIGADGFTQLHQQMIVDLAARNRLAASYPAREFVEAGGLIAYAVNYPDLYFRFASFIDRIFNGAKPGELPVEQPTKFELVINLKTAKALGLTIPQSILLRADELIQ